MGKIAKSPSDIGAGINWENYIILLQADKYRLTGKSILTNMVIGYVKFTHCLVLCTFLTYLIQYLFNGQDGVTSGEEEEQF